MQPSPPCPVCGGHHWQTLGKRTWRLGESNDPIVQKRLRVLFEVWMPGSKEFTASSELCQDCGFIIYAPRPTAEELNDKYRFLTTLGPDTAIPPIESEYNAIRRRTLFEKFAKSLPKPSGNRILDFGGGDGRLLKGFVDRGDRCFLVDYLRWLGRSVAEPPGKGTAARHRPSSKGSGSVYSPLPASMKSATIPRNFWNICGS